MTAAFLIHIACTLIMTGVIWFIQIHHYPLVMKHIDKTSFVAYERAHQFRIAVFVVPLMIIESITGAFLLWSRPAGVSSFQVGLGVALLAVIWLSTWLLQIPQHRVLARAFNEKAYRLLITSNWIRTIGYSARAGLVLWMVHDAMA